MKRVPWVPLKASASWKFIPKKRPAMASQKGDPPALVDHAAKLRQHLVGEALAMELDEQIAAARQQHAEAARPLGRMEEQAAHFRASLEIGAQGQHFGAEGLAELRRGLGEGADPVGIERASTMPTRLNTWQVPRICLVSAFSSTNTNSSPSGAALLVRERLLRARQLGDQGALVGGQVGEAAAGQLGHLVDRLEILVSRRPHPEAHKPSPCASLRIVSADRRARSARLSTIRYSAIRMDGAAANAHRVDDGHAAGGDVVAVAHAAGIAPADRLAEIGAAARDQREQLLGRRVERLGRAAPAAVHIYAHVALGGHLGHRLFQRGLRPGLVGEGRGTHIYAQDRMIGHDIVRAAAVDPGRVDAQPLGLRLGEAKRQLGRRQHGVAPVLGIAAGMGAPALHDQREIAASGPGAGERPVRQGRRLVGERRLLAARRLRRSGRPSRASRPPRRN